MKIRGLERDDYNYIVSVLDRWFGGASAERAHPIFFYELGRNALIAEVDGETAGFLLGFVADSTGYVHLVGIHPSHRRRGVGKALYEHFTDACRQQNVSQMKAITVPGNEGSIEFHQAQGFSVHEDPDYAGRGRPRIVFTKAL